MNLAHKTAKVVDAITDVRSVSDAIFAMDRLLQDYRPAGRCSKSIAVMIDAEIVINLIGVLGTRLHVDLDTLEKAAEEAHNEAKALEAVSSMETP